MYLEGIWTLAERGWNYLDLRSCDEKKAPNVMAFRGSVLGYRPLFWVLQRFRCAVQVAAEGHEYEYLWCELQSFQAGQWEPREALSKDGFMADSD